MKPLPTNQRGLTWLCLLPAEETTGKWEKGSYVALVLTLVMTVLSFFSSSLIYTLKFMSIDSEGILYALYAIIAGISMINSIIVAFAFRSKIPPVFEDLSKIYGKYKDDELFRFLARATNISEWLCDVYFKFFMSGIFVAATASSITSALLCWRRNSHFDAKLVFHPYRFVLPWDQSTLLGYFGEIIFSILSAEAFLVYNGAILLTFVSICLHHQAFSKMFQHKLRQFDRLDENRNDKEFLCEIINFHNLTKRWFQATANVYSPHLMVQLICNMLMVAVFLFRLDQQLTERFDVNVFAFTVMSFCIQVSNLFASCFLGKLASESYRQMANVLYDCNWNELSLDLQKFFIIMIGNAQRPLYYRGYGTIELNLETFCALMRAVYTYYMVFKTVNAE